MASQVNQSQFLGSRISLISRSEIRYEGILYALDLNEATISLAKVRSYGTEDRPTERPIPGKEDVFEFIIFRGADIKVIDVVEPPKHAPNPTVSGVPSDPAIVDYSHSNGAGGGPFVNQFEGGRGRPNSGEHRSRPNGPGPMFGGGGGGGGGGNGPRGRRPGNYTNETGVQTGRGGPNRNINNMGGGGGGGRQQYNGRNNFVGYDMNYRQGGYNRDNGGGQYQRGRTTTPNRVGGFGQQRGGRQQPGNRTPFRNRGMNQAAFPPKVAFDGDYDFEKANEELLTSLAKAKLEDETTENKDDQTQTTPEEQENKEQAPFYKKDDFFDNISCESLERSKGNVPRVDWKAERKLNAETFGLIMNSDNMPNMNMRLNSPRHFGQRMPRGGNMLRNGPGGNWMGNNGGNFFRGNRRPRIRNN